MAGDVPVWPDNMALMTVKGGCLQLLYDGGDPMEFRDYLVKVQKACKGEWPCWH